MNAYKKHLAIFGGEMKGEINRTTHECVSDLRLYKTIKNELQTIYISGDNISPRRC